MTQVVRFNVLLSFICPHSLLCSVGGISEEMINEPQSLNVLRNSERTSDKIRNGLGSGTDLRFCLSLAS